MSTAPSRGPHGRARLLWVLVAGLGIVVLSATGLASRGMELLFGPGIPAEHEVQRLRDNFDGHIPDGAEAQREAFRDGKIEAEELLVLAENASNCSLMAGSRPISVSLDGGGLSWSVAFGSGVEDADQLMRITDRCWEEHIGAAEIRYGDQSRHD